jgi:hypothetical protein
MSETSDPVQLGQARTRRCGKIPAPLRGPLGDFLSVPIPILPFKFIIEPFIFVVVLEFPKNTGNAVVPFVATQSIVVDSIPVCKILKTGLVVF